MKKVILGFVGEIGCGKGTAVDYFLKNYDAESFKYSDPFRKILVILGEDIIRDNIQKLSESLRREFGQDILEKVILKNINLSSKSIIILDGIRRENDIEKLKLIDGFKLIYIESDPTIRFERIRNRNENQNENNLSYEQFLKESKGEAELTIIGLKEIADFIIENNGTTEEFYGKLKALI